MLFFQKQPACRRLSAPYSSRGQPGVGAEPGSWSFDVSVPGDLLALPGGYLVTVELGRGGVVEASGQAWLGKVALRARPLDVAFVLPVALGVHRDPSGAFFDQVLEQAVAPANGSSVGLRAVTEISSALPNWQFTLAIEPILLTQLRDMTDGYSRIGASGTAEEVGTEDPSAKNAAEVLAAFGDLARRDTVDTAAGPYAGAALGALAAEGWRDGFDQIQLGKQELLQTLSLEAPPVGAYSPDLDMTTESLAYYGQASVDHVVVDGQLAADLTEPVGEGAVAARVRDIEQRPRHSRLRQQQTPRFDGPSLGCRSVLCGVRCGGGGSAQRRDSDHPGGRLRGAARALPGGHR